MLIEVKGTANATSKPAISGPPQVDETLRALLGSIADADTLPATFPDDYTFQWLHAGATDTEISGATDSIYTPVAADIGKQIKVRVGFTDGGGTTETLTSDAYPSRGFPSSAIGIVAAKTACPAGNDWCTEMTVGYSAGFQSNHYGYASDMGSLDDPTFGSGVTERTVQLIRIDDFGPGLVDIALDSDVPSGLVFNLGGTTFTTEGFSFDFSWSAPAGFGIVEGQKLTVSAELPPVATVAGASATEGSPVPFAVNLSEASDSTVTVDYATSVETGNTATSGDDFTATSGTLTVPAGDTTAVISVPTVRDLVAENDETFTLTLSNPSGAFLGTDSTATRVQRRRMGPEPGEGVPRSQDRLVPDRVARGWAQTHQVAQAPRLAAREAAGRRVCRPIKRPRSRFHDRAAMKMFLRFFGRHRDPATFSQRDWDRFIRGRRAGTIGPSGKPVTNRMVQYDLTFLIAVFNWATRSRDEQGQPLLVSNSLKGLKMPKAKNPTRVVLAEDEYGTLLQVSRRVDWRFHVALVLAHETGHRIGAIRKLRWSDVDMEHETIRWRGEHEKTGY